MGDIVRIQNGLNNAAYVVNKQKKKIWSAIYKGSQKRNSKSIPSKFKMSGNSFMRKLGIKKTVKVSPEIQSKQVDKNRQRDLVAEPQEKIDAATKIQAVVRSRQANAEKEGL